MKLWKNEIIDFKEKTIRKKKEVVEEEKNLAGTQPSIYSVLVDSYAIKLRKPSYLELSNICYGTHTCLEILQKHIFN